MEIQFTAKNVSVAYFVFTPMSHEYFGHTGMRIVAVMPVQRPEEPNEQNHVVLLLNSFDELRRRVPAGK